MAPFIALVSSTLFFRFIGWAGLSYLDDWQAALRFGVAVMFLLTATAHWGKKREDLVQMVPPFFPKRAFLVTLTGYLELAGAVGILIPVTIKPAAIGLALLLILMFPANVYAARHHLTLGGKAVTSLKIRTVMQLSFVAAVVLAGWFPF